ncbi:MAG: helicase-related protein [Candidatus Syntropharchaeia archaeon]
MKRSSLKESSGSILITTPESFDSLISRRPEVFKTIKVVALDELHLLDGGPRGDQLRVLIERLKLIADELPSFYALSATIADPWELGKRYILEFKVTIVSAPREIEEHLFPFNEKTFDGLINSFREKELRKILTFCNTRQEAEWVAKRMNIPPFREEVWVHHASLSKLERESVEERLNRGRAGICVATTTLELGIDIGDIDAVVLWGAPPDTNALLQRLGRGNRRRKNYMLAYGVYRDEIEKILFSILFQDAKAGRLSSFPYSPKLSVACQQIFSYLHQKRRIRATFDSIKRILTPLISDEHVVRLILGSLVDRGWVEEKQYGTFSSSEKLGNLIRVGKIHSNIEKVFQKFDVIDAQTGRKVGSVEKPAPRFSLGGRIWELLEERGTKIYASPVAGATRGGWVFRGRGWTHWDYRTGARIKSTLFPNLEPFEFPYVIEEGKVYLVHFAGELYGWLWGEALRERGVRLLSGDGVFWSVEGSFTATQLPLEEDIVLRILRVNLNKLRKIINLGSFFHFLPEELKLRSVYETIHSEDFINYTRLVKFREVDSLWRSFSS